MNKPLPIRFTMTIKREGLEDQLYTNCTEFDMKVALERATGIHPADMKGVPYLMTFNKDGVSTVVEEERPISEKESRLLLPTDSWTPQRKHTKELFEGYIRAKYGWMEDWEVMYNEGIKLLRDADQPVFLKYIENFMEMMVKKFHPSQIGVKKYTMKPRFFEVIMEYEDLSSEPMVYSFSDMIKYWPELIAIIEHDSFNRMWVESTTGDNIRISKLNETEMSFDSKE